MESGEVRELARGVVAGFSKNDLLTFASAISFQVMTALIPLFMFGLALIGVLDLTEAWSDHLAPQLQSHVSHELFALTDKVVRTALGSKQLFWLSAGFLLTIWEISGGVRAVMDALTRIYADRDERPKRLRYGLSFVLALAVLVLGLLTFAIVRFQPNVLHGEVFSVLRWPVAFGLLSLLAWLLLRFAPDHSHADHLVSVGSGLCVLAWIGTSLVFGLYVSYAANYGSIFSGFSALFALMTYLYISACVFLAGAQLDALLRERWERSQERVVSAVPRSTPREDVTPRPAT
jgi:membrane protein